MDNNYSILGINKNATEQEIKSAYRKLVKEYHPDKYANNPLSHLAEEKFKEINEAYKAIRVERKRNKQEFDSSDYDSSGFHKSGYNRKGFDRNGYDKNGFNKWGYDSSGFHKSGYNRNGYNRKGFDKDGYDKNGFNKWGYDSSGFHKSGYNRNGYNRKGFDKDGYDKNGFNKWGYDSSGFHKSGYNRNGFDRNGFDRDGYDKNGFSKNKCNKKRFSKITIFFSFITFVIFIVFSSYYFTSYYYNPEGYNVMGYDKDGYTISGYNENGYDRGNFNKDGYHKDTGTKYNSLGFNKNGYDRDGFNKDGYHKDTGTKYNSLGFNKNGYDKNGGYNINSKWIQYEIEKDIYNLYFSETNKVNAIINNKTYEVIVSKEDIPITIYRVEDFDNNGFDDALVEIVWATGGNGFANSYFFISAFPDNKFSVSERFGYDWNGPEINLIDGEWITTVDESTEGFDNNLDFSRKIKVTLANGRYKIVEEFTKSYLKADIEITSLDFEFDTITFDEIEKMEFDLNNDGYPEKFKCKLWHRWGRFFCTIIDGKTKKIINNFSNFGLKRVGILATKTNGYNDLILEHSTIIKWDGEKYSWTE